MAKGYKMSRVGKKPIELPKGVDVKIDGQTVTVKGPKGELKKTFDERIKVEKNGAIIEVKRDSDERQERALHGLTRALLNNMVVGVSTGFNRVLEITESSTGYRAEMKGKDLELFLGFSHSIPFPAPAGISFAADSKTRTITISGTDKELVGEIAARIRKLRPPEPYNGKGIKYQGENVRRKAGKSGKAGKK
jgi:large subunit ribosomal protein L6